ncbi:MAG TPA: tetratricopeptide repeat protein [Candidatus Dormibacteraeota bacterium]|nr:tetratricopeptide repeat protein [Candidatus Dormibacteraeota bacterium]
MRVWGMAAIAALVLRLFAADSFGAENVAPTKAELEEMYNAAFRAFDSGKFAEALKQLDAIDARQPDLAASKNLRGVIQMRQGNYDQAEAALQDAARIDPKFWNARFNLAEIPFLRKDWPEARNRFEQLLSSGESDLAKEASQLIQYKILLTYLLEGKDNMVDSIQAKLELSPDTPAVDYVKAAVALKQKNQKEAKDWIGVAEKNFSPQLNKLFAESLYEVGWLEKPAGEARPSLPLMTAAERSEKTKATARTKFEQAQQALRQRDLATALKLADEADQADPNQASTINLRGEILMQQEQFDQAEAAFKKAAKLDPKLREAQYNLAQVPFKKKEYAKARDRFETLYKRTPGGDKNQAAELIKFKIYMTLLLEGKESRAHAMMDEFQFTGDTPALYYAQAGWEFQHNNPEKAADWTASANKIYSSALNSVFADAFYDVGWMQRPAAATMPTPAFDTAQAEGGPAVEPSPIPDKVFAANSQSDTSKGQGLALGSTVNAAGAGLDIAGTGTAAQPAQPASALSSGGSESTAAAAPAESPQTSPASKEQIDQAAVAQTSVSPSPAAEVMPVKAASSSVLARGRMWLVGGLLLAALLVLAWVTVPTLRRRYAFDVPRYSGATSAAAPVLFEPKAASASPQKKTLQGNGFVGGPRQISLQLKASKLALRHSAVPSRDLSGGLDLTKGVRAKPSRDSAAQMEEPSPEVSIIGSAMGSEAEAFVGPVVEQAAENGESLHRDTPQTAEMAGVSAINELTEVTATAPQSTAEIPESVDEITWPTHEASDVFDGAKETASFPEEPAEVPPDVEVALPAATTLTELPVESINLEPTVPDQTVSTVIPTPVLARAATLPSDSPRRAASAEPILPQTTTPAIMPETTQTPTAPVNQAPAPPMAKPQQPPAAMQTSVQLTFSFEIAAMQLTPSFKMGALKVRPISKLVTMRLPSQQPQSALNLQVSFEVAKIQPASGALGTIRMVPSQQQRPTPGGLPSFAVAGLQVVPNSETAPVQLTPSRQGRASVLITVPFQITTLEFAPSLEIASVILNSNSKQVAVQLPGAGPSPADGAPMFEIANLELGEGGEIGMMHLNPVSAPKRA